MDKMEICTKMVLDHDLYKELCDIFNTYDMGIIADRILAGEMCSTCYLYDKNTQSCGRGLECLSCGAYECLKEEVFIQPSMQDIINICKGLRDITVGSIKVRTEKDDEKIGKVVKNVHRYDILVLVDNVFKEGRAALDELVINYLNTIEPFMWQSSKEAHDKDLEGCILHTFEYPSGSSSIQIKVTTKGDKLHVVSFHPGSVPNFNKMQSFYGKELVTLEDEVSLALGLNRLDVIDNVADAKSFFTAYIEALSNFLRNNIVDTHYFTTVKKMEPEVSIAAGSLDSINDRDKLYLYSALLFLAEDKDNTIQAEVSTLLLDTNLNNWLGEYDPKLYNKLKQKGLLL